MKASPALRTWPLTLAVFTLVLACAQTGDSDVAPAAVTPGSMAGAASTTVVPTSTTPSPSPLAPTPTFTATALPTPSPTPGPTNTATPPPTSTPAPSTKDALGPEAQPRADADRPVAPLLRDEPVVIPTPLGGASVDWERAIDLFHQGHELQLSDRLQEAVGAYQRSIAAFPTFEAHIYLGWTYSWMGAYELAIVEAKRAIELGPDYGNAYNDIGAYLIAVDQLDEAIPWLRKAMNAKRYASPHYPHLNLGAIWVRKGLWKEALKSYEDAIRLVPEQPLRPLPTLLIPASALTEETARALG